MSQLTHINAAGEAHMVDVSAKAETVREARAEAFVTMRSETLAMIIDGSHHKGDVFATARIAGIQAAKRTWDLIPLCHPLMLSKVEVNLHAEPEHNRVRIETLCRLTGKTGVEMEALTAASVAALTIYDMCKAVQKDMVIGPVRLLAKSGGKSGDFKVDTQDKVMGLTVGGDDYVTKPFSLEEVDEASVANTQSTPPGMVDAVIMPGAATST